MGPQRGNDLFNVNIRQKNEEKRQTLLSVEVDLDGGVSSRVEDLTRHRLSNTKIGTHKSKGSYLASVDFDDRHGSKMREKLQSNRRVISRFCISHALS